MLVRLRSRFFSLFQLLLRYDILFSSFHFVSVLALVSSFVNSLLLQFIGNLFMVLLYNGKFIEGLVIFVHQEAYLNQIANYNQYYFMQWNQEQISKTGTNSHLLSLLTKRSTKSITNLKSNWPGKHSPSLVNILTKPKNQKITVGVHFQNSKQKTGGLNKSNYYKMIKSVPLIKMSSTSLSLQPSARSKSINMRSTWRTSGKITFYSNKGTSDQKKDSKFNPLFDNETLESYKKENLMQIISSIQNKTRQLNDSNNVLNNYEIDYKAFNYIDKVIDNPEKWTKFVHKKRPSFSNQFLTQIKQNQRKQ